MTVAGTGHRPNKLGGYSVTAHDFLVSIARTWLQQHKPEYVISGMALGWDTALAEAAILENILLICAVPFKGQENMWPKASQEKYLWILERAHRIHIVCEGGYAPWKMQTRNKWMIDQLTESDDIVLAMHDGSPGGTANCIQYANQQRKTIINLYKNYTNG